MLKVLLIGEIERAEFRAATNWLAANAQLEHALTIDAAEALLFNSLSSPAVIVFALARPGIFADHHVARLRKVAPLSRFVSLAGSWCEGQAHRNGAGLAGVQRVIWHEFPARMRGEFARLEARRTPVWGLPLTAGVDEQADFVAAQPLSPGSGLVFVDADDEDSAEAICDLLSAAGYAAVWGAKSPVRQIRRAVAGVLCGAGWGEKAEIRLKNLKESLPTAPVLVLLDFPREQDVSAALAAGATAVLAKPFTIGEFLGQLNDARQNAVEGESSVSVA